MARLNQSIDLSDASNGTRAADSLLVITAFALGQAVQINNGVIHPAALGWLGLAIVTSLVALRPAIARQFKLLAKVPTDATLAACIAIQSIELIYWDTHWNSKSAITVGAIGVAGAAVVLSFHRNANWKWPLAILIAAFAVAAFMTIRSMPNPIIDVFAFQQDSSTAFLHGHDPYGVHFRDLYGKDLGFYGPGVSVNGWLTYSFPYPPLTLLLDLPGRLLGDIRYSHVIALCIAACLMVAAFPSRRAFLAAAMLLLTPRSLLVIKAAWTEPMVILTVAAVVFCARRAPSKLWIALGLLLAIKQYMILALPIVPMLFDKVNRPTMRPTIIRAISVAALITLPFVAWDPISFVRSVMLWQFRQPFRTDSLSYPAMISRTIGGQPGVWVSLLAAVGAMVIARQSKARGAIAFVRGLSFVMLVFFALSKQAFCNYYFLVIGLTCAAIATTDDRGAESLPLQQTLKATDSARERVAA